MSNFTPGQASDPSTPPEVLAQIAYERPELRAAVAANPSAYPELLTWLETFGDPHVNAAIAARTAGSASGTVSAQPDQPAAPFAGAAANSGYGHVPEPAQPSAPHAPVQHGQDQSAAGYGYVQAPPGYGQPTQQGQNYPLGEEAPKRKRKGLLVGGIVGAVAVLGVGGAFAANHFLTKVKPADTPDGAVTKLFDAVAAKDGLELYGSVSPAEFEHTRAQFDSYRNKLEDQGFGDYEKLYGEFLDAVEIDVAGLAVDVEEIEPGLAKVHLTDGKLTIDGDPAELARLASEATTEMLESPLLKGLGAEQPTPAEVETDAREELEENLPLIVDAKSDLNGEGFLMVVEEGNGWYVSPYLTIMEYAFLSEGGGARGSLPDAATVKEFSTPEAAAEGATDALMAYLRTGDKSEILNVLPLAERRVLSIYGDIGFEGLGSSVDTVEVRAKEFNVRATEGNLARVTFKNFDLGITTPYETLGVIFKGSCITLEAGPQSQGEICVDEAPLIKEFGLQDLSFVTIKEGGSWFLSPSATLVDGTLTLGANVLKLQQDGRFEDEQWMQEQTAALEAYLMQRPALVQLFSGAMGAGSVSPF